MKRILYQAILLISVMFISACEGFLEPELDNRITYENLIENPGFAEGLLLKAYVDMPDSYNFSIEAATDDAVTNDFTNPFWKMGNGQWSSDNNPASVWTAAYNSIFYINEFLSIVHSVPWDLETEEIKEGHRRRLKGEAFGLRAWNEFLLIKNHAGPDPQGALLGYPIIRTNLSISDEYQLERNSYQECIDAIIRDCDSAIYYLPDEYIDIENNFEYNITAGERWTNRINGKAVKAFKTRVLLYHASPAFNLEEAEARWIDAAIEAGNFLNTYGGLAAISPSGIKFWEYPSGGPYDPEIIWATTTELSLNLEKKYFPPSFFGNAEINPSQELIDAFGMLNGYPTEADEAGFIASFPYRDRDPRLNEFILYDNSVFDAKGSIRTHIGATPNGINVQSNSTRTGYYLRKFLIPTVSILPFEAEAIHFYTHIRFTEVFLNYAEAANEAWGPDGSGSIGFSARDVVSALRERAGIAAPDEFLATISDKSSMRELIRNERRIELCFEGHRFYDIRRWKDIASMKSKVSGVFITPSFPAKFEYKSVETREYKDHMVYGPIPYNETLKYEKLQQNQGW